MSTSRARAPGSPPPWLARWSAWVPGPPARNSCRWKVPGWSTVSTGSTDAAHTRGGSSHRRSDSSWTRTGGPTDVYKDRRRIAGTRLPTRRLAIPWHPAVQNQPQDHRSLRLQSLWCGTPHPNRTIRRPGRMTEMQPSIKTTHMYSINIQNKIIQV